MLFCGLVDLGGALGADHLVREMARHLAAPFDGRVALDAEGPVTLAAVDSDHAIVNRTDAGLVAGDIQSLRAEADITTGPGLADLYSRAGQDATLLLDGEFAFAHWCLRSGTLSLVRDRAGVRPVFFCHEPGAWFAFASFPGALMTAGLAKEHCDPVILAKLAVGNFAHGSRTVHRDIERVLPGHVVTLAPSGPVQRRYWSLSVRDPISPRTDWRDVVEQTRDHLRRAVRQRLPADGSAFAHLSGGLDSSSISALAAAELAPSGRRLRAYAFYPTDSGGLTTWMDERPEVEAVVEAYPNIDLVPIRGWLNERLGSAPLVPDMPVPNDGSHCYSQVLADARAHGARTILAGFGGDQGVSFNGAGVFSEMLAGLRWRNLVRISRERQAMEGRAAWRIIARDAYLCLLPRWAYGAVAWLRGRPPPPPGLISLLNTDYVEVAKEGALGHAPDTRHARIQALEWGHMTYVLEEIAWRAAQHGLTYSAPLLDRDLLEFAIRAPAEFCVIGGQTRALLRLATEGVLPDKTRLRDAKRIPDPFEPLRIAAMRSEIIAQVERLEGTAAAEVFNLAALRKAIGDIPEPEEISHLTETYAAAGVQYTCGPISAIIPLLMARFAAENSPG